MASKESARRTNFYANVIKKEYNKLFLTFVYVGLNHISLSKVGHLTKILSILTLMESKILGVKKMLKSFPVYRIFKAQMEDLIESQKDFIEFLVCYGFSKYEVERTIGNNLWEPACLRQF